MVWYGVVILVGYLYVCVCIYMRVFRRWMGMFIRVVLYEMGYVYCTLERDEYEYRILSTVVTVIVAVRVTVTVLYCTV